MRTQRGESRATRPPQRRTGLSVRRAAGLAASLLAAAAIAAPDEASDYLDADLRQRVDALKAEVRRTPSNRANGRGRAETLWAWVNAYARAGRYVPVNATATVSRVLSYPDRAGAVQGLDPTVLELALLDEQPNAIGTLSADTGPFRARDYATIRQTYTVGDKDIQPLGGFVVARHFMPGFGGFQTEDESADNYVSIRSSNPGVRFSTSRVEMSGMHGGFRAPAPNLVFRVSSGRLMPGDRVTITYGDTSAGGRGLLLPRFSSDRMPLPLYLDFDGSGLLFSLPIAPIVVTGAEVAGVHGFAPSVVAAGEPFDLTLRAQDRFYNRATGAIPAWQVLVDGELLATVPAGTSAIAKVEDMRFDEPGVYRFEIRARDGAIVGTANPVLVEPAPGRRVYWGDTHGHSGFAEGVGTPDSFMTWARDDARLDYVVHSEHDIWMDDYEWRVLKDNVQRYSNDDFVAFLGYEWTIQNIQGGHHNVLFRTAEGRLRIPAQEYGTLTSLYHGLRTHHEPQDVVVIPHAHQAGDYRVSDGALEPLIEIMSQHGTFDWFAREYLSHGRQVGFVAASDNHLSQPGYSAPGRGSLSQRGGLGALRARERSRDALFDAMRSRSAYATTGDRIILDVTLNDAEMGSRIPFAEERRIAGRVVGTAPIDTVTVLKNGEALWERDYRESSARDGSGLDGEYRLIFASESEPVNPGDNPRGWRWWRGGIAVDGARATAAEGMDFHNEGGHAVDVTDGSSIAFRTHTRGGTSSIRLHLADVQRGAKLTLSLTEGREFGGGPPRFRPHRMVPGSEVVLALRDMEHNALVHAIPFGTYQDTVTLRRVVTRGEMDVSFEVDDEGARQGDYYYVRVRQANDAIAWSSPIWVGGYPAR